MTTKAKISKWLKVEGDRVYAKTPLVIRLRIDEYKNLNDEEEIASSIEDIGTVYKIPGFFTIENHQIEDTLQFFFPYDIYLKKTDDIELTKEEVIISYEEGELIFYALYKSEDLNLDVLSSLFQNGAKYLGNHPDKLIIAIWQQLASGGTYPVHHIELIISQLYSTYDKSKKRIVPLRLTEKEYSKKYITNITDAVHRLNNSLGFAYGYSNNALRTAVSQKSRKENSFFEDIMSGDYDSLIKKVEK